ncbi:MAG: DUF58 domain-containing protein [Candidatus Woesearchaeota archaeon]|nr:DUF58 domain-containing protein [Candidatus Woesearchaeota archaeon]
MYELKLNFKPLLKQLEIYTKREAHGALSGSYLSKIKGRGLEFDSFREYNPNDDASRIDWKASIRAQHTLVRDFREERNVEVVFILDVSSSMCYGSIDKSKAEYAAELVAALSFAILRAGDSIGLIMFSSKVVKEIPSMSGLQQYYNILKTLGNPTLYEGGFDFENVIMHAMGKLKKGAVIIFISDFIGLKPGWETSIRTAMKKFDVIALMIRDPLDNELPSGIGRVAISDPFTENNVLFDSDKIKEKYSGINRDFIKSVNNSFMNSGGGFIMLSTEKPFTNDITRFFIRRQRVK